MQWVSYKFIIIVFMLGFIVNASAEELLRFNQHIRPILSDNCFACHGPDEKQRKKGLRLDTEAGLFGTGSSGSGIMVPGKPEDSLLVQRISDPDPDKRMPPPESHLTLSTDEIDTLVQWIKQGADWEGHWAFIPPTQVEPPQVKRKSWPKNPIDSFILKGIEAAGLKPAKEADETTLIRRVALDLTGLPPTPLEISAYLEDRGDGAYERMVERYLASPRYGEHMALGWLELARYADTDGYQNDRYRYMHVWRDWVIEAFNANKPYDEFIIEQLAGDMLPDATLRQQIASGFGRNHRINSENGSIPEEWRIENVIDRTETFGTAFLGLTLSCARCHDHKYDPISQREYYQLFAHFNQVPEWGVGPNNGNSPPFITVPESWPNLSPEEDKLIPPEPYRLNQDQGFMRRPQSGSPETVMVMQERDEPRPTYKLNRGLYNDQDTSEALYGDVPAVTHAGGPKPKNRLALARWLMEPDHPLTARVAANRLWQHFFGIGLVATTENFGLQGAYPSHPELLDWLAVQFIKDGWDVKAFQKRVLMSATYRQSSKGSGKARMDDPDNRLLSHGPRLRLTGQQLRDQALFASGLLAGTIGGPSVKPYMPPQLWESVSNEKYDQGKGDDLYRRSMYTYWRRTTPPPLMTNFNAANREICTVRIDKINSPLHALSLMNNTIFLESARHLATVMIAGHGEVSDQIEAGFLRVISRVPDRKELNTLKRLYSDFLEAFEAEPASAEALLSTGASPYDETLDAERLASMTLVASTILNLDEAIMRN